MTLSLWCVISIYTLIQIFHNLELNYLKFNCLKRKLNNKFYEIKKHKNIPHCFAFVFTRAKGWGSDNQGRKSKRTF